MTRRKLREYDAKRLLAQHMQGVSWHGALVSPETALDALPLKHSWSTNAALTVKPDQLFGKRGKSGLVLNNVDFQQAKEFILSLKKKEHTIGKAKDTFAHFLIEPFIPHESEYYLSITSERDGDLIQFSVQGGVDVEEQWHTVKKCFIPTLGTLEGSLFEEKLLEEVPEAQKEMLGGFIESLFSAFRKLDFVSLELNPFAVAEGRIHLLDAVAQVDDCAAFQHAQEWKELPFPRAFGQKSFAEEEFIESIDQESGASLKLTILNPEGRIWNILSGGGASIIYLDTIAGLGKQEEIANYGEYSGNPTTEESYQYARTVLELMTREKHPQGKILIIGGAIANFTDVEKTFLGIIRALKEYQDELRVGKVSVFVRRGGPNYEQGLRLMQQAGKEIGIPMLVQGPDTPMVGIVGKAMEVLE